MDVDHPSGIGSSGHLFFRTQPRLPGVPFSIEPLSPSNNLAISFPPWQPGYKARGDQLVGFSGVSPLLYGVHPVKSSTHAPLRQLCYYLNSTTCTKSRLYPEIEQAFTCITSEYSLEQTSLLPQKTQSLHASAQTGIFCGLHHGGQVADGRGRCQLCQWAGRRIRAGASRESVPIHLTRALSSVSHDATTLNPAGWWSSLPSPSSTLLSFHPYPGAPLPPASRPLNWRH